VILVVVLALAISLLDLHLHCVVWWSSKLFFVVARGHCFFNQQSSSHYKLFSAGGLVKCCWIGTCKVRSYFGICVESCKSVKRIGIKGDRRETSVSSEAFQQCKAASIEHRA
jgi:hypothetical protein